MPTSPLAPEPPASSTIVVPETLRYRLKNVLLGPPLVNERLGDERLGRPSALGILAPDCISSSAYGTEQMLTQLIPAVGLAGFVLVVPVTMAILGVLFFVTLSYLDVIGLYTKAGGAYVVARENFGPTVAQVAAVALLIDYTVTVAVQVAAGTAALTSAVPSLLYWTVPITLGVILLLLYGNLRGIREAGRIFAFPTYFFVAALAFVIVVGYVEKALGTLHVHSAQHPGTVPFGHAGSGWLYGASFIVMLRAFANGGSSLTGLEAISNGVATFREPASVHARQTLVVMSSVLAFLVLGVTLLAHWTHAVPYLAGSPTVVSQEVQYVLGTGTVGKVLFYVVQLATMLILYTGGNTSFNGFPFLASFVASDAYLPRQLTRRGHRLAFSNGIIVLTVVAVLLVVATGANLTNLVALYAIGVFTGFAMAGSGMVKHHLDHRQEKGWRLGVAVSGISAVLTALIVAIFATVKFTEGAWVVVIVGPVMFLGLIRLHRRYLVEEAALEEGAAELAEATPAKRHEILVLVDRLDNAVARALQYARTLRGDEVRAVHFVLDPRAALELEDQWQRLGLAVALDVRECEDRRIGRAALELAAEEIGDGRTELSVLLPRRVSASGWHRILHDNSAEQIANAVGRLDGVTATVVPYELAGGWLAARRDQVRRRATARTGSDGVVSEAERAVADRRAADVHVFGPQAAGSTPIGQAAWRTRVTVAGRLRSVRVQPKGRASNLECLLADGTGQILLVFQGRKSVPGLQPGARMVVEGMVGDWARRPAILNPRYELLAGPESDGE